MPKKVKIPIAIFEYRTDFKRPIFEFWVSRASAFNALFETLSRWKITIDDLELITTGKLSEQGVRIKLTEKKITLFFGASAFKLTKDDAGWDTAEETIEILDAALRTLIKEAGAELNNHKTAFALHLQPTTKPFLEILKPFLSPALESLGYGKLRSAGGVYCMGRR